MGLSLLTSACGSNVVPTPPLYERLGKTDSIAKIVDGLIANVGAECAAPNSVLLRTRVALLASTQPGSADPTRLQRLRNHFIDQLGAASDGPLTYTGKNMVAAHTGTAITKAAFSVWRSQFEVSLATSNVAAGDKAAVYAITDQLQAEVAGH